MKVHGACHCGAIRYEAEIEPAAVGICHCTDCQTLSGSAYRVVVPAAREGFHMTGTPKVYVKTAASGTRRAQAFCGDCGSALYAAAPEDPPVYSLRVGTIAERRELGPPVRQIWCDSAIGWAMSLESIPKVARQK
jgi:hypothetical protein